jgi:hypothetical protein
MSIEPIQKSKSNLLFFSFGTHVPRGRIHSYYPAAYLYRRLLFFLAPVLDFTERYTGPGTVVV